MHNINNQRNLGFWQAFKAVYFEKLFTYSGRSTRREYWKSVAVSSIFLLPFGFLLGCILAAGMHAAPGYLIIALVGICIMGTIWSVLANLSLTSRRLHDIGLSFWWCFAVPVLHFILGFALRLASLPKIAIVCSLILILANLILTLFIFFAPSQKRDNRFGENPYPVINPT